MRARKGSLLADIWCLGCSFEDLREWHVDLRRGEATEWCWYQCIHSESLAALDAALLAVSYHLYFRALDEPIAQSSWTIAARCPLSES